MLLDRVQKKLRIDPTEEQKLRKVNSLLQELRRAGMIDNRGTRGHPRWVRIETNPKRGLP